MLRKRYLYSNVPVPKSTRYRKLREERARVASQLQQESNSQNIPTPTVLHNNTGDPKGLFPEKTLETSVQTSHHQVSEDGTAMLPMNEVGLVHDHHESQDMNVEGDHMPSLCDGDASVPECNSPGTIFYGDNTFTSGDEEDDAMEQDPPDCHQHKSQFVRKLDTSLNALTPTTEGDALLMCLALGFRHCLSWVAIVDMLKMINTLFDRAAVKATKYFLFKYTNHGRDTAVFHVYCPKCERYLGHKKAETHKKLECPCGWEIVDVNKAKTFFLSLNLDNQLKQLLEDPVFVNNLNYRFERQKSSPDALEDIFDGLLYQKHFKPGGVLYERFNMSYTFNIDGFPIGKSSKQTCWPIYVQINELPPHLRSKYILLAGIYIGRHEPNMKIFLLPFVEEANVLSTEGINWNHNGVEINSKIIPLCACLDSAARCKVVNMNQFNGRFGCTLCLEKPKRTERGLRFTVPFENIEERSHMSILRNAEKAYEKKVNGKLEDHVVKGVKGPSPIHKMLHLDIVKGVRPDPMHNIFRGVSHAHTDLLLKPRYRPDFSSIFMGVEARSNAISSRLESIRPPSLIRRPPRSLKEVAQWKAIEWRSWLLFYGVVCLKGLVDDKYVIHFSILATATHILLQKSILPGDLDKAYAFILKYVLDYQRYFGEANMVHNIHLLLHTKKSVQYLGPLWTHSAFDFDGENRYLLQLKKSAPSVAQEVATKYLTYKSLPTLCEKYASSESAVEFCESLCGKSLKCYVRCGDAVLFGKGHLFVLHADEVACLAARGYRDIQEVKSFSRMLYKGVRYTTDTYSGDYKYDDSFVCVQNQFRGRIRNIFEIKSKDGDVSVAIILQMLTIHDKPLFSDEFGSHNPIRELVDYGDIAAIKPHEITGQCIAMFLDNGSFICDVPYGCKGD